MNKLKLARRFGRDEDGAVTVDWVVLTATFVGFAVVVLATISGGARTLGDNMSEELTTRGVYTIPEPAE